MARTKQTVRKVIGGRIPRSQLGRGRPPSPRSVTPPRPVRKPRTGRPDEDIDEDMPEGYRNQPQVQFWQLAETDVKDAMSLLCPTDTVVVINGKLLLNGQEKEKWIDSLFDVDIDGITYSACARLHRYDRGYPRDGDPGYVVLDGDLIAKHRHSFDSSKEHFEVEVCTEQGTSNVRVHLDDLVISALRDGLGLDPEELVEVIYGGELVEGGTFEQQGAEPGARFSIQRGSGKPAPWPTRMTFDYTYSTRTGSALSLHSDDHDFEVDDEIASFFEQLGDDRGFNE